MSNIGSWLPNGDCDLMAGAEQNSFKEEVSKTKDDTRGADLESVRPNENLLDELHSARNDERNSSTLSNLNKTDTKTEVNRVSGMALSPLSIDGTSTPFKPGPQNLSQDLAVNAMENIARLLGNKTVIDGHLLPAMPTMPNGDMLAPEQVPPVVINPEQAPEQSPQKAAVVLEGGITQEAFKLGNRDYQLELRQDGRAEKLAFSSPDGNSTIEMQRAADGGLVVTKATGDYLPKNGTITFEGMPVQVGPDGKILGDLQFRSNGDVKYCAGGSTAPDRVEYIRSADGTLSATDFKTWKKTTISPDGQVKENYWDGWEFRNGEVQADGSVKFVPPDPNKPDTMKREFGNGVDKAKMTWTSSGVTHECDFVARTRTRNIPGPPVQTITRYSNGGDFAEVTQVVRDQPGPGDLSLTYKDPKPGEPLSAVIRKDGSMTTVRPDKTVVEKDADGYVKSVSGPRGSWEFQRDVNGDVYRASHTYQDQNGNQVNDVMMRRGRELYPGMERWRSAHGLNAPIAPFDLPPRDIEKAIAYNQFVDANGNVMEMNLNVTADGTVRIERGAGEGKTIVSYESPGQSMYRDLGSTLVSEHPGSVIETFDKAKKESTFKFSRAGREFTLNSTEGKVEILTDGSVLQDKTATNTRDYYLPNGVVASIASDGSSPPKPVCKEIQLPRKDNKYATLKVGQDGVTDLKVLDDSMVQATVKGANGEVVTVYNPKDGSYSEKAANDKFWRVNDPDGKYVGPAANPGQIAWTRTVDGIVGADGINYENADWTSAETAVGPEGELLLTGRNAKAGYTARLDLTGNSIESGNGVDVYRYPATSDITEARYENGKLVSMTIRKKVYRPEASPDAASADQLLALVDPDGNRVGLPTDTKRFDKVSGRFIA